MFASPDRSLIIQANPATSRTAASSSGQRYPENKTPPPTTRRTGSTPPNANPRVAPSPGTAPGPSTRTATALNRSSTAPPPTTDTTPPTNSAGTGTGTSSTCTAPSGATTLAYDSNGNQSTGTTYTPFDQQATTGGTTNYSYAGTTNNQRLSYAGTPYTPSLISNQTTQHGISSPTKIIREPSGGLIAYQTGGDSYYYITDRQSSVVLITGGPSNTPALAADYDYTPYGATISATGAQATFNEYRYTGTFIDITSTGLYKMGARYYNQDTGRFTQPDPSGQEFNRYNYTSSNPVSYLL